MWAPLVAACQPLRNPSRDCTVPIERLTLATRGPELMKYARPTHSASAATVTEAAIAYHVRRCERLATVARHSACTAARTAAFMSSAGLARPPAARRTRAMPG